MEGKIGYEPRSLPWAGREGVAGLVELAWSLGPVLTAQTCGLSLSCRKVPHGRVK